jgi:hypothetical protein
VKRYAILFAVVVVAAIALLSTRRARVAPDEPDAVVAAPVVPITITVQGGTLAPARMEVPVGSRVRITIENRDANRAELVLAGYEDRFHAPPLAPGGRWSGEFEADRPGDDFAWTLDGQPAGILRVTGSHLVEGHR